jgi:cell division protein FtsA
VLTGGSALMQGMVELGEEVFHMPVRLGVPQYVGGLSEVVRNPRFSTGVGLLLMGKDQFMRHQTSRLQGGGFGDVMQRMQDWFRKNF